MNIKLAKIDIYIYIYFFMPEACFSVAPVCIAAVVVDMMYSAVCNDSCLYRMTEVMMVVKD